MPPLPPPRPHVLMSCSVRAGTKVTVQPSHDSCLSVAGLARLLLLAVDRQCHRVPLGWTTSQYCSENTHERPQKGSCDRALLEGNAVASYFLPVLIIQVVYSSSGSLNSGCLQFFRFSPSRPSIVLPVLSIQTVCNSSGSLHPGLIQFFRFSPFRSIYSSSGSRHSGRSTVLPVLAIHVDLQFFRFSPS
jgi:hypothetical protein